MRPLLAPLAPLAPDPVPVLSARGLRKSYGAVEAVRGIDIDVWRGTCLGLLGPNGAGKSTTIEMLQGVLPASSGEIRLLGRPMDRRSRERIGIVFQLTALQDYLTVRDNLRFFATMFGARRDIEELARLCMLQDVLDRDARRLSGGQRQRLLLAIALINSPDLLFLDEPTTGLDPTARRNVWALLAEVKRSGVTIVMSTHYMDEAAALCDQIAIVNAGRIAALGTPYELLSRDAGEAVIELPGTAFGPQATTLFELDPALVGPAVIRTADLDRTIRSLVVHDVALDSLRVRAGTLEDLFISMTGREFAL